jgi:iron complex outermembrane receptor protein
MTQYVSLTSSALSIALCAVTLASADSVDEDIGQVFGKDDNTISIATGYRQPLDLAPAVATAITAEEIKALGATTLDQVIERVAGIHVSTTNALDTVSTIRGITSRVLILLNNVPVAQGLFVNAFGQVNNILVNDIERIEVIRGPESAVYGADAFAGVMNIVTKTASDIHGTEIGARAGSFDTYDGWLLHGGRYGGFDVALSASGRTTAGFDETIGADAQTPFDALFGTTASLAPAPLNAGKDLIDARVDVSRGPWTWRMGYFGQLNLGTGVGISKSLDPEGEANYNLVNTDLTYHDRYSDVLDITAQLSYVNLRSSFDLTAFPPGAFDGLFPEGVRQDLGTNEGRTRAELTALWLGLEQHRLRVGLGGVFESLDVTEDKRNYTVEGGVPVPTGVFAQQGGIGDVPIFPDDDRTIFYTSLQDEWSFAPDWRLTTGVRVDRYSDFGTTVNPRVGLVWNTDYRLTTKGSW